MMVGRARWTAAIICALAMSGCVQRGAYDAFTATDGTTFGFENRSGYFWPDSTTAYYTAALKASGAHDLRCPVDELEGIRLVDSDSKSYVLTVGMPAATESAVIGCGWRAAYRLVPDPQFPRFSERDNGKRAQYLEYQYRIELVSRLPSAAALSPQ